MPADHSKNLGYLDAFLAALENDAAELPPAAGARLKAIVAEERVRWAEVKHLLAGGEPSAAAPEKSGPPTSTGAAPARTGLGSGFTVGSIKRTK